MYDHFRRWRRDGVFARIVEALQLRLDKQGLIDWDLWCVDGASVRAALAAAGACKKVTRKEPPVAPDDPRTTHWAAAEAGFGIKFHLVTDGRGTPLAVEVTAGQVHKLPPAWSRSSPGLLPRKHRRCRKPKKLAGDKGYSVKRIRDWLKLLGIEPVIPHKDNEKVRNDPAVSFDKQTYRQRHVVEQCVGWLKECRRIGTRFEKLAVHFHGMIQLAMIRRYLNYCFQTEPKTPSLTCNMF